MYGGSPLFLPQMYEERDLSRSEAGEPSQSPRASIRRSFSWGKKKKAAGQGPAPEIKEYKTGLRTVDLEVGGYDGDGVGFAVHPITEELIVCALDRDNPAVRPAIERGEIVVGDVVRAIQGVRIDLLEPYDGEDLVDLAVRFIHEQGGRYKMTVQTSLRTVVLERSAAIRGTSVDKLGLELSRMFNELKEPIVYVEGMSGVAAKSRQICLGDRLVSVNGTPLYGLDDPQQGAEGLLSASASGDEIFLEFAPGMLTPDDCVFDFRERCYRRKEALVASPIKRTFSWGKKGKKASAGIPAVSTEIWDASVKKDSEGKLGVTLAMHEVTNELIIGIVSSGSKAEKAGLEAGHKVIAIQGVAPSSAVQPDDVLNAAYRILRDPRANPITFTVQNSLRTEVIPFGQSELGGPRDSLGVHFYSGSGDTAVRIIKLEGTGKKSGRLAVGDKVTAINGQRVADAKTLNEIIARAARTSDDAELEVLQGYAAQEGLYYSEAGDKGDAPKGGGGGALKIVKRSFSFGRKPRA